MQLTWQFVIVSALALGVMPDGAEAQGARRSGTVPPDTVQARPESPYQTEPASPVPAPLLPGEPAPAPPVPAAPPIAAAPPVPAAPPSAAQGSVPAAPGLPTFTLAPPPVATAPDTQAQALPDPPAPPIVFAFGDDTSDYANDGECDDRRFRGAIMANTLTLQHSGHDATDCRNGVSRGLLVRWQMAEAVAATRCDALPFGADSGDYANDNQCDDPRFEGIGMSSVLRSEDSGIDASDCRRLCDLGMIGLRDY